MRELACWGPLALALAMGCGSDQPVDPPPAEDPPVEPDDPVPVTIRTEDVTASEGEEMTFPITLDTVSEGPVELAWRLTGDTADLADDIASPHEGTLTIAAGERTATIVVEPVDDDVPEGDDAFTLEIFDVVGAEPATLSAVGVIDNDDFLENPAIIVDDYEAAEGTLFAIPITLEGPADHPISFTVSAIAGTAEAGVDYEDPGAIMMTIEPGDLTATFDVQTIADLGYEEAETFALEVTAVTGTDAAAPTATATISQNDGTWSSTHNSGTGCDDMAATADALLVAGSTIVGLSLRFHLEKRHIHSGELDTTFADNGVFDGWIQWAYDVAVQGNTLYVAGTTFSTGGGWSHRNWNGGAIDITTGDSTWSYSNNSGSGSTVHFAPLAVATAADGVYFGGYRRDTAVSGGTDWRVEKRSLTDGSPIDAFGTSGVVQVPVSTWDEVSALAVDGSDLFVAGPSTGCRLEKWDAATGAFTTGVDTTVCASRMVVDAGWLYLTSGPYVEKRSTTDLSLDATFGDAGLLTITDPVYSISFPRLALDGGSMFLAGSARDGDDDSYLQKRSITDGALVTAFGDAGGLFTSSGEEHLGVAVDADGVYTCSGSSLRVTKRLQDSGAL